LGLWFTEDLPVDLIWEADRHSRKYERFPISKGSEVIVVATSEDKFSIARIDPVAAVDGYTRVVWKIDRKGCPYRFPFDLVDKIEPLGIGRPCERAHPCIQLFSHTSPFTRLVVVQHEPKAVALVSWPLLRAVRDVLSIRRIQWRRVARLVVRGDVLRLGRVRTHVD